jgi:hypothetical protein
MSMQPGSRTRLVAFAAAALVLAAGCNGGAAVASNPPLPSIRPIATVAPTPTPTPKPSPSPTPTPKPSASQETATRAVDKLKIGSPYTLFYNPANQALGATFNIQIGTVNVSETMSGLEIRQRAKLVGLLYVLEMDGIPMSNAVFEGGARGAAANAGGTLTYAKVLGKRVAYIVTKQASFAMFLRGDVIVMVGAQTLPLTKTLLTSVIKANH